MERKYQFFNELSQLCSIQSVDFVESMTSTESNHTL